jgi:hypothetical protein
MIIKFDPLSLPSQAIQNQINLRSVENSLGWYVTDKQQNDINVNPGDYFIVLDSNNYQIILRTDYLASAQLQRTIIGEIAIQLLEDIIDSYDTLPVTDTIKQNIQAITAGAMIGIIGNKLQFARKNLNATAVTGNFTAPIKAAGLAMIDAAIAKL